jgi:malate/lactate dehydrogenase
LLPTKLISFLPLFAFLNQGTWVSMGVYSDGSYGIQPDIIYSFPVTCQKGEWSIVQGKFCMHQLAQEWLDFGKIGRSLRRS